MTDTEASNVTLFHDAVSRLAQFASASKLLGPNFGVAISVLLHRSDPERYVISSSGSGTTTSDLQLEVCDPTWEKSPDYWLPSATGPIYKPFTLSFKGKSPAVNNWRNSFDIQGGIGCDAPLSPDYFESTGFVTEHRFDCGFRDTSTGKCAAVENGALCFNPEKKGSGLPAWTSTRARHRPKLLRRGSDSSGNSRYWSVEPTVSSLADLLGDTYSRVSATDFSIALFAGSPYWSRWSDDYSPARLQRLLGLDDERFLTLFAVATASSATPGLSVGNSPSKSLESLEEQNTVALSPELPLQVQKKTFLSNPVDYVTSDVNISIEHAGKTSDPERRRRLLESATRGHRRVLNTLAHKLQTHGYSVDEQPGGYDLHAVNGDGRHLLFEAKTWTPTNLASQVRSGWAQLEEYAFRNLDIIGSDPELVLALNHRPPADFWAWDWFKVRNAPYVLWLDGNDIRTFDRHASWLTGVFSDDSSQTPM